MLLYRGMKKICLPALLVGAILLTASGCVYANNKGWDDMTAEEQEEIRQEFAEIRKEMEKDASEDSLENAFEQLVLDAVEQGLAAKG